jgi:hypothetical protein
MHCKAWVFADRRLHRLDHCPSKITYMNESVINDPKQPLVRFSHMTFLVRKPLKPPSLTIYCDL